MDDTVTITYRSPLIFYLLHTNYKTCLTLFNYMLIGEKKTGAADPVALPLDPPLTSLYSARMLKIASFISAPSVAKHIIGNLQVTPLFKAGTRV